MDSKITHIPEQSSEFYSEMSSYCCFLLRQLFLVQKTAHARGAVREPKAMVIAPCLSQGGHPSSEQFVGSLFSLKIVIFDKKCLQNGPQHEVFWNLFFGKCAKTKKCVSTAPARTDCM